MFNLKNLNSKLLNTGFRIHAYLFFVCKNKQAEKIVTSCPEFSSRFVCQNLRSLTFPKLNWPLFTNYGNKIQKSVNHLAYFTETKSNKNLILGTSSSMSFGNKFHTRYRNLLFNGVVFHQLISLGDFPKMSWIRV